MTDSILYSNSCSFGAPNQGHKVYADYVAAHFNCSLINQGYPGSCNRRILRTSLRDLLSLSQQYKKVTALIGLTFIARTELWQPQLPPNENDGHFASISVNHKKVNWSQKGLIDTVVPDIHLLADKHISAYYKEWLLHFNPEGEITNLLTDLIMFTGWATTNKIQYKIFSNVDVLAGYNKVGYDSPFIHSLRSAVDADKNILDLWQFSFGSYALSLELKPKDEDLYGRHGHPGAQAHKEFAKILINHFNENNDSN